MKVQLVVVRGKPEGKVIPLVGPNFKIGRGETCHLRPNSEQVSREHAEFTIDGDAVSVRDLGSRNGTLVNGKALTAECRLKHGDLVQVGPLTFAVSIAEVPVRRRPSRRSAAPAAAKAKAKASPDDVSGDEIDSWLLGEGAGCRRREPDRLWRRHDHDHRLQGRQGRTREAPAASSASDDEYERQAGGRGRAGRRGCSETADDLSSEERIRGGRGRRRGRRGGRGRGGGARRGVHRRVQPVLRRQEGPAAAGQADRAAKPSFKDTSDAAGDILRRLMERRRASKE